MIKMYSFVDDTVLDPFLGSGTTSLAAKSLGRNSVGYEVNPEFLSVIEEKLGIKQEMLFKDAKFEVLTQRKQQVDFAEGINKLPYVFKDPVKFDKKVDPRKLQFGSKINGDSRKRQDYYCVKKVLSPTELELDDGLKIRLLGIKEKSEKKQQAIEFLQTKTKGQKVFMKFGQVKHDRQNNLLCYLYLQNKTFINAHLVKQGLVSIDTEMDFEYKKRFISMAGVEEAYQR